MGKYLDDILYIIGVIAICIGTYQLYPVATWFVAGVFCLIGAVLWARAGGEK
jgi:hypothetical protein